MLWIKFFCFKPRLGFFQVRKNNENKSSKVTAVKNRARLVQFLWLLFKLLFYFSGKILYFCWNSFFYQSKIYFDYACELHFSVFVFYPPFIFKTPLNLWNILYVSLFISDIFKRYMNFPRLPNFSKHRFSCLQDVNFYFHFCVSESCSFLLPSKYFTQNETERPKDTRWSQSLDAP